MEEKEEMGLLEYAADKLWWFGTPPGATLLMVIITIILAAVLYVMVLNYGQ